MSEIDRTLVLNQIKPAEPDPLAKEYGIYDSGTVKKTFTPDSYNGPSLNDFKLRINILYAVAAERLKSDTSLSLAERKRKLEILESKKIESVKKIEQDCQISEVPLQALKSNEKDLIQKIRQATIHIQEFLFQALILTKPDAFTGKSNLVKALRDYEREESRLTAKIGRPNFINTYSNPFNTKDSFISVQRTLGKTIPSTERYDEQKGVLPNFVQCGVYSKKASGEVKQEFAGYRHSSYPPIRINDDFERQKKAASIVKSMLVELTRQQVLKGKVSQPIELNLSSLALLTPYHSTDSVLPKGEREHRQLSESYDALMLYHGRNISLEVDGKPFKVKLNAMMLNAPGNPLGVKASKRGSLFRRLVHSRLEKNIDAQGMNQFIQKGCVFLKKLEDASAVSLISDIEKIYQKNADSLTSLKFQLAQKHEELEKRINIGKDSYGDTKREVEDLKKKIFSIERQHMREFHKFVMKHRGALLEVLNSLKDKSSQSDLRQVAELFFQTLLIYVDGKAEPIQYGSRFLLANQKMGNNVDFYCKSGEDRTGRMQNMLEELCIFYNNFGHYPAYDPEKKSMMKEDQEKQARIALVVNEFSVSRDIAGANTIGARGLQITESLEANKPLPADSGNQLGKMAKGVYSLRHTTISNELLKKIGFDMDIKRQILLKDTLQKNRANTLFEAEGRLGFSSRIIKASEKAAEEAAEKKNTPFRTSIKSPTYVAERLLEGDLIVTEKKYDNNIIGRIEKDTRTVKDTTRIPPGGLPDEVNEELAIEQAFAMVSPPFNAKASILVLDGTDSDQVARIHAVLLVLQRDISSLKDLEIEVVGNQKAQPREERMPDLQKQANQEFIDHYLRQEAIEKINTRRLDFTQIIQKQQHLKSVMKVAREENELNILSGTEMTLKK